MKRKRRSPAWVKVLACLLLLGSLAMLFLPWLTLGADRTNGDRLSLQDALALVGESADGVIAMLEQEYPGANVGELARTALEGRYSPLTLAKLLGQAKALSMRLGEQDLAANLGKAELALWGLAGLLALLGLVALICIFTDHKGGIFPYVLLAALSLTGTLLLRGLLNDTIEQEASANLQQFGADLLVNMLGVDLRIVHMGIAAYLCPLLGLGAFLLMFIRKKRKASAKPVPAPERKTAPTPAPAKEQGWVCPRCGSKCGEGTKFCVNCGTKRPETRHCTGCGAALPQGAAFCPACGTRVAAANSGRPETGGDPSPGRIKEE